ncbi:peroxiredoxin-like family protein [Salsuginibacillus halophilus]|uniref:peroxiredoxin-like family protein n=1 Tax=Salsuginibacillus halophilus TaxID=517424 RepID=UPI0031F35FFD
MRKSAPAIQEERGVRIVGIFPSPPLLVSEFEEAFGPFPFTLACDPKRHTFRALGHPTLKKRTMLAKAAVGILTRKVKQFLPKDPAQRKVATTSMKTQDVYIQGGTWLVDEQGNVRFKHIDDSPENHASIEQITDHIDQWQKQG